MDTFLSFFIIKKIKRKAFTGGVHTTFKYNVHLNFKQEDLLHG